MGRFSRLQIDDIFPIFPRQSAWAVNSYYKEKQGITGDTNPLTQDYLMWANTECHDI